MSWQLAVAPGVIFECEIASPASVIVQKFDRRGPSVTRRHRGWVGSDLPNAVAYVVIGDSHSWSAVPYLLEILHQVYHSFGVRL